MNRFILAASLLLGACMGTATYSGSGTYASGEVYGPDLVTIEPGIQVIADYDEPVFYADNYYWRNDGGYWYRSSYYDRGWITASPPVGIVRIGSPDRYRRYRPEGYTPRQRGYDNGPQVRDHRGYNDNRGYNAPPQGPTVRDHRYEQQPQQAPIVRDHRDSNPPPQGPIVRDHRDSGPPPQGPIVRDHRDNTPPPRRNDQPQGPVVREHR